MQNRSKLDICGSVFAYLRFCICLFAVLYLPICCSVFAYLRFCICLFAVLYLLICGSVFAYLWSCICLFAVLYLPICGSVFAYLQFYICLFAVLYLPICSSVFAYLQFCICLFAFLYLPIFQLLKQHKQLTQNLARGISHWLLSNALNSVPYQSGTSCDIQTEHYHSSIRNNKGKICEEIPNFVVCHIIINFLPLMNAVYNSTWDSRVWKCSKLNSVRDLNLWAYHSLR
jgi:hypothetical protein